MVMAMAAWWTPSTKQGDTRKKWRPKSLWQKRWRWPRGVDTFDETRRQEVGTPEPMAKKTQKDDDGHKNKKLQNNRRAGFFSG